MAVNGRNSQIDCCGGLCGRRLAPVGNPVTLGQSPAVAAAARAVGHNLSTTGSTGRGSDLAIMICRRPRRPLSHTVAAGPSPAPVGRLYYIIYIIYITYIVYNAVARQFEPCLTTALLHCGAAFISRTECSPIRALRLMV